MDLEYSYFQNTLIHSPDQQRLSEDMAAKPQLARASVRWLYLAVGWASLGLGIVGVVLPLLPTTPFLLVSAFAFGKGSDRLHAWLLHHRYLGPPIHQWNTYRAISRKAKWLGTLSLVIIVAISLGFGAAPWIVGLQVVVCIGVCTFLWTRPEPPEGANGT